MASMMQLLGREKAKLILDLQASAEMLSAAHQLMATGGDLRDLGPLVIALGETRDRLVALRLAEMLSRRSDV